MTEPLVLRLTDPRCTDVDMAGGKGASLARMLQSGLNVPPGFVITSAAFASMVDGGELRSATAAGDMIEARRLIREIDFPPALIESFYTSLTGGPVAVRSSACAEDSDSASYAGQQETFLNVEGVDAVATAVVECWLSFWSDRAVFYRQEKGSLEDVSMAVVVQQMVDALTAGVLFTVDPVHGRRDRMVVEAARGLGEHVVSGEVTPDHYTLDQSGGLKKARVVSERVLTDAQLAELATVGLQLAQQYGCAQDIEWAFDEAQLYLLQSRPITTL